MSKNILSFDIGIKNLAWCVTALSGETIHIQGWGNYNLLEGCDTESITSQQAKCATCGINAKYTNSEGFFCGRHIPTTRPKYTDISGNPYTKLPTIKLVREFLTAQKKVKSADLKLNAQEIIQKLQEHVSIPVIKKKTPHTLNISDTHDSLRKFVRKELANFFFYLDEVRIENQPVLKNPVMKTVQMLLFATLRDAIFETKQPKIPVFRLVHAKVKVAGAAKGDAGYKERKDGSELRVKETLTAKNVWKRGEWLAFFEKHKKRSDLADAFCMCLDGYTAVKGA